MPLLWLFAGIIAALVLPSAIAQIVVDAIHGHDTNPGTVHSPFQTIERAVLAARGGNPKP